MLVSDNKMRSCPTFQGVLYQHSCKYFPKFLLELLILPEAISRGMCGQEPICRMVNCPESISSTVDWERPHQLRVVGAAVRIREMVYLGQPSCSGGIYQP